MLDMIENRTRELALALLISLTPFAACGDNALSAERACTEQAEAWCALAPPVHGYTFDCVGVYRGDCAPALVTVDTNAENACLDAIAENPDPWCVPNVCTSNWARPSALIHFCRD